ncbi:hypothetical protein [Rhizobium sp. SGZ-381]|uniref:hypothetical protein n=1 Tax=Rhizobium sp. SGZ-381 TaxID=3342800 RepID=UPI00367293B3
MALTAEPPTRPRLWYPDGLIDETLPTGLPSAQAWFDELRPERLDLIDESERAFIALHGPGQTIGFQWMEDHGEITVMIGNAGLISPPARCTATLDLFDHEMTLPPEDVPVTANHFWDHESEIFAETLDDFAQMYAEALLLTPDDEPHEVVIATFYWSGTILFRIGDDGLTLTELPAATAQSPEHTPL